MRLTITSHELADVELAEAAKYSDSEVPGLGQDFLTEFEHGIGQLRAHPKGTPIILGAVRRKLLRRFPYGIIDSLHEERFLFLPLPVNVDDRSNGVGGWSRGTLLPPNNSLKPTGPLVTRLAVAEKLQASRPPATAPVSSTVRHAA